MTHDLTCQPEPGAMIISTCIGCGCDDLHACVLDSEPLFGGDPPETCYWMRLDRDEGLGVCSMYSGEIGRWDAGDRSMSAAAQEAAREYDG